MWWYVLSGSLNWDILVFAKIDPSIASAKQLHLQSFIPGSGDCPVDFASAAASATSVVAPSPAATHSVISGILPAIISNRLLPAIVAANWSIAFGVGVSIIPSILLTAPIAPTEAPEVREIDVARTPRVSITASSAPVSIKLPFSVMFAISPSVSVTKRSCVGRVI